jgi:hypothetical protein
MIKLGIRGSTDAINHIIIKIDDLMLINANNLFLVGDEERIKIGKNLVQLLNSLSRDHEISVGKNVAEEIERELNLNGEIIKYVDQIL